MKLRELFKGAEIKKLDPVNTKAFYDEIDVVYEKTMENGTEKDKKTAQIIKNLRDAFPNGFLVHVGDKDLKDGTNRINTICEFLGYNLENQEHYDFLQYVMFEQKTIEKYNGDVKVYKEFLKAYERLKTRL